MDKIDEWMKRLSGNNSSSGSKPQTPKKGDFSKKQRKFTPGGESKHKPQSGQDAGPTGHGDKSKHRSQKRQQDSTRKSYKNRYQQHKRKQPQAQKTRQSKPTPILRGKLKIIPLGGLSEVGKNMMVIEYENDIIIIDMGFEFPSEDLLGIDYVIPDTTYLEDNKKRIRGVVLTHGHLDHIGGIPYILPKLDFPPLFGTKLTMGLVKKRIEEFKQEKLAKVNTIDPDKPLRLGRFTCSFFRVAHSIPDAVGIVVDTPVGKIVNTGDFKFDETPPRNQAKADVYKMKELGRQNVLALFCESTNALKEGHSMSEREVGFVLDNIIKEAPGRIIIASFSSQIGRIQQIIDGGIKNNRQIFVSGRSMRENIQIADRLGYLNVKKDAIKDIKRYKKTPDKETLILTTGSQGEAVSALTRMANKEHPHIKVKKGDTIIFSSSPIVGNERAIYTVINNLSILGAEVIHNQIRDVHTSGHGKQDELAQMINLVNPKYLVPIHGEYYMRTALAQLAKDKCGIPENRIIMMQNGDVLVGEKGQIVKSKEKVDTKYVLIDGRGEGQMGSQVLVDREILSQNGTLIVLIYISKKTKKIRKTPDVVSRGFTYMHETEKITQEISKIAEEAYRNINQKNPGADRKDIKKYIRQSIDKFTNSQLERRPLIVPLIVED